VNRVTRPRVHDVKGSPCGDTRTSAPTGSLVIDWASVLIGSKIRAMMQRDTAPIGLEGLASPKGQKLIVTKCQRLGRHRPARGSPPPQFNCQADSRVTLRAGRGIAKPPMKTSIVMTADTMNTPDPNEP